MELRKELNKNGHDLYFVTLEGQLWEQSLEKEFKKLASNLTVKGFRTGKVPLNIAKTKISDKEVQRAAVNSLLNKAYGLVKETINHKSVIYDPIADVAEVNALKVVFKFEIFRLPDIELSDYKKINCNIDVKDYIVTDEKVEEEILQLRRDKADFELIEDQPAKMGDNVNIDFTGTIDGNEFAGGKATDYDLILGSKKFVPGFEEQLVGARTDDEIEVKVKFPENYHKELAGKDAIFKVKINSIYEVILPELNLEFLGDIEDNSTSVETYKEKKFTELKKVYAEKYKETVESILINSLIDNSKYEISSEYLERFVNDSVESLKEHLAESKLELDAYLKYNNVDLEDFKERIKTDNIRKIIYETIIYKIAELENIQPDNFDKEHDNSEETQSWISLTKNVLNYLKDVNNIKYIEIEN